MAFDLDEYAGEAFRLVQTINRIIDPSRNLRYRQALEGQRVTRTEIHGYVKREGVYVFDVKEVFNLNDSGGIDKDFRYTFLAERVERLAIENHGNPDHAHFPNRYLRHNGRHFSLAGYVDYQDVTFPKMFDKFNAFVNDGGQIPEPFRSAAK